MQWTRHHWWQLLLVCGVAFACRLVILQVRFDSLHADIDAYLEIAQHIADGKGFSRGAPAYPTAYRPPLYPLLIAALLRLGGLPTILGMLQVMLGTVTVAMVYRTGQLLRLRWASLIAALIVALDPLLLQYTVLIMTEVLCATLVATWCWIFCEWRAATGSSSLRTWKLPLLQGLVLGLVCLCRPVFLAAALIIVVLLLVQVLRERSIATESATWRRALQSVAWIVVGLVLTMSPWIIRNSLVIGKATPATTHGGYTLLLGNNPTFYHEVVSRPWGTVWQRDSLLQWQNDLELRMETAKISPQDEVARDRWMYRQALSNIRSEPELFVRACFRRAVRFWDLSPWVARYSKYLVWGTALFYGLVTISMLLGLWRLQPLEWKQWSALLALPLLLWCAHWFYWTDMRMRAPVIPVLALLAARGCLMRPNLTALSARDASSVE